jgi:2-polyprenyl-3-methyl-5-hydroxy-6-metoxy-1,4-benzoquinol methylase
MRASHSPADAGIALSCRFCDAQLTHTFVNLGMSPLCQTQIPREKLNHYEAFYPLHAYVCEECFLVQLDEYVTPYKIFSDEYPYFSSYSDSWVEHARRYCEHMQTDHGVDKDSFVVEVASNDGYLLQHFAKAGISVLGIEPTANTAAAAREKGIETEVAFFGADTAEQVVKLRGAASLIVGNNVLAHVPDIRDFVEGMRVLLADDGIITLEFPHLLNLIDKNQFDTIYHEHFSYLSLFTVQKIFAHFRLTIFDVLEIPTHGGSLRIYARHERDDEKAVTERVDQLLRREIDYGLAALPIYEAFAERVYATKRDILTFLIDAKSRGKSIAGYGAPGKGNTLLNFCGIGTDFLDYTVDRSPHKYGTWTPGSRIPILHPSVIESTRPDYLFILPWNLTEEIVRQTQFIRQWQGRWIVPIPRVRVID